MVVWELWWHCWASHGRKNKPSVHACLGHRIGSSHSITHKIDYSLCCLHVERSHATTAYQSAGATHGYLSAPTASYSQLMDHETFCNWVCSYYFHCLLFINFVQSPFSSFLYRTLLAPCTTHIRGSILLPHDWRKASWEAGYVGNWVLCCTAALTRQQGHSSA